MPFASSSDRHADGNSNGRIVRPDNYVDNDLEPHDSRNDDRRGGDELSYDEWVAKQTSNGWPEWLVRWAFPRENYEGTNEFQGLLNFGSFAGSVAGGYGLIKLLPEIIAAARGQDQSEADMLLKSLYGDAYTPGNNPGILSHIKDFFSGMSSQFGSALSGLGSGLLGIGSQLGSSILNYQNQVKLIDKQNAYNTPMAQMDRFSDAGLNPNLIYGLGSNGNQPASGSIAPVDFDTAQRENRLARMQIATQTQLAEAEVASKMSDARLKDEQANNVKLQTAYQGLVNNNYLTQLKTTLDNLEAQTDNLREEKRRISADADTAEVRARIAVIDEQIAQNEKEMSDKRKEYNEADIITHIIGNVFGLNVGVGFNMGRSSVRSYKMN